MKRATGRALTYFRGRTLRHDRHGGGTVCVVDPNRATTGKRLVFYRATDKVSVDGNDETDADQERRRVRDFTRTVMGPVPGGAHLSMSILRTMP
jgi:hypothetical protein